MMYKALLIGCGNIGAMYDWDNEQVITYAKALSKDKDFDFEVYDNITEQAAKVAARYGISQVKEIDTQILKHYDMVIIASSTTTHYNYLKQLIPLNLPLIVCEKPVDTKANQLQELKELYQQHNSKVLVNFYRRFQPAIDAIRKQVAEILKTDICTHIQITYQRGLHNNGSHAFDLMRFLFDEEVQLNNVQIHGQTFDEFADDATITLTAEWNGRTVHFTGLQQAQFSHFEADIYFRHHAIRMQNGCNEISILQAPAKKAGQTFYPRLEEKNHYKDCLKDFMTNVLAEAKQLLANPARKDNFIGSVGISAQILHIQN